MQYGNGFADSVYVSFPLACMNVSGDELTIKAIFGRKVMALRRTDIVQLSLVKRLIADGVRIHHNRSELPQYIVVYMLHAKKELEALDVWRKVDCATDVAASASARD